MKLCFVSTKDAIRGILAEAIAKQLSKNALLNVEVYSAGIDPSESVIHQVLEVLREKGYPTEGLTPKHTGDVPYAEADVVITLSSEARDTCPYVQSHKRREHWPLEELKDFSSLASLRRLRDQIEDNIKELFKMKG